MEQTLIDVHSREEDLELYAMGRLGEPEAARLEEHLLLCEHCQEELARVDDFVRAFQIAAPAVEAERERTGIGKTVRAWLDGLRDQIGAVHAAPALVMAAIALVLLVPNNEPAVSNVELRSERGEGGIVTVSPGSRLHITMDTRGLPELGLYRIELVDSRGVVEWTGPASLASGGLVVTTERLVGRGRHWVRVYGKADSGEQLLREFGVNALVPAK